MASASDPDEAGRPKRDRGPYRSDDPFRLLVESVIDYAIFMLDPDGFIESWNLGAERLKGYSPEEILGTHYSVFYPSHDREAGLPQRLLAEARAHGHVRHTGWRVRADGTRFWADVVINAVYDDDGTLAGFGKVTRDMTDVLHAQEAREQALADRERATAHEEAEQWRRDFISTVVHDLQSPVIAITGFAELFAEDWPPTAEQHREFVDRIRSNAGSLQSLIDHLRTYTRLEAGSVELTPEPIVVDDFVTELLADMEPVLDGQRLERELEDVVVRADPRGLERILRNLLGNAVRHSRADDLVRIRARSDGDLMLLEVADEGEGIPEELQPHVFDRFKHGRRGGTGLGLWIVEHYVELHGGRVSMQSTPGRGTTVGFTLPPA